ncbi:MAG: MBL fold metallo-hydrolase [Planctomycetes bacterium]|nr:MBL fold metallo-hydrolase [Planctomycetota bacterium]
MRASEKLSPRLLVLGSGSILPHEQRSPSGYALRLPHGKSTLLDAGPGTLARFGAAGGRVEELERICLTHFHPDHCLDVASVLFARRNPALAGALPALEICGPRGVGAWVASLQKTWGSWVREEGLAITELAADGSALEREGFSLSAYPTHHTDHALCFRFRFANGAVLCYSGDSDDVSELALAARDADWLLCECSFADADYVEGHLTPSRVARVANAAGARRVVLTHFYPSLDPRDAVRVCAASCGAPVQAARDGAVFLLEPAVAWRCA